MRTSWILTINKTLELAMFEEAWPCIFDISTELTIQGQRDHWGFHTHIAIFGYKIFEIDLYDIRHTLDEVEFLVETLEDTMEKVTSKTIPSIVDLDKVSIENSGIWQDFVPVDKRNLYLFMERVYTHTEQEEFYSIEEGSELREAARIKVLEKRREFLTKWVEYNYNN